MVIFSRAIKALSLVALVGGCSYKSECHSFNSSTQLINKSNVTNVPSTQQLGIKAADGKPLTEHHIDMLNLISNSSSQAIPANTKVTIIPESCFKNHFPEDPNAEAGMYAYSSGDFVDKGIYTPEQINLHFPPLIVTNLNKPGDNSVSTDTFTALGHEIGHMQSARPKENDLEVEAELNMIEYLTNGLILYVNDKEGLDRWLPHSNILSTITGTLADRSSRDPSFLYKEGYLPTYPRADIFVYHLLRRNNWNFKSARDELHRLYGDNNLFVSEIVTAVDSFVKTSSMIKAEDGSNFATFILDSKQGLYFHYSTIFGDEMGKAFFDATSRTNSTNSDITVGEYLRGPPKLYGLEDLVCQTIDFNFKADNWEKCPPEDTNCNKFSYYNKSRNPIALKSCCFDSSNQRYIIDSPGYIYITKDSSNHATPIHIVNVKNKTAVSNDTMCK